MIDSKSYSQPFWVGYDNPRFPYARNGYLPALEPDDNMERVDTPRVKWTHDDVQAQIDQIKSLYFHIERRVDNLKKNDAAIDF